MDTRAKIITPNDAARIVAESGPHVVTGYFNPLRAEHARRLGEVGARNGRPVLVVILPGDAPLLGVRARAELVAALSVVDYVVPSENGSPPEWLGRVAVEDRLELEAADERLTRDFVSHVLGRHS